MYVWYQIFIIVAIIYRTHSIKSTNGLGICDCDVLQINDPLGVIGNQNFTKQKQYLYVSSQWNVIYWSRRRWSYYIYNPKFKIIELNETDTTNLFSLEDMCKDVTTDIFWNGRIVKSRCLRDKILQTRNCSAKKELTRINQGVQRLKRQFTNSPSTHEKFQANNPCKFPFIYKNVTYKSCTKKDYDKFWCATTVNATNHQTHFGTCNDLCPNEEDISRSKDVEVTVLTNGLDNCDCDLLQINDTYGPIGYQNFTKQNGLLNGKPYYFSRQGNMISWRNQYYDNYWSYEKYNTSLKMFESTTSYPTQSFSFENKCNDIWKWIG